MVKKKKFTLHRPSIVSTTMCVASLLGNNVLLSTSIIASTPISGILSAGIGAVYFFALLLSSDSSDEKKKLITQMSLELYEKKKQSQIQGQQVLELDKPDQILQQQQLELDKPEFDLTDVPMSATEPV